MNKCIIKSIVLTMIFSFSVFICCSCSDEAQTAAVEGIQKAVESSIDASKANGATTFEEYRTAIKSGLETELESVKEYQNAEYKKEEFKAVLDEYIGSLESSIEGIEYYGKDSANYNEKYIDNGMIVRAKCLKSMKEDYGLKISDDYADSFTAITDGTYRKAINLGDITKATSDLGDVELSIDGVEYEDADVISTEREWGEYSDDETKIVIKYTAKNLSYSDENNGGFVSFDKFIKLLYTSGLTVEPSNQAGDHGSYGASAGAFSELAINEQKKFATEYIIEKKYKDLIIQVGDDSEVWFALE